MKSLINYICIVFLGLFFIQCDKSDFMDKFPPEILYKWQVKSETGDQTWEVSPNAKQIELETGETEWTVRARVSAPGKLKKVVFRKISGSGREDVLEEYTDFSNNPNVYHLEYSLSAITKTMEVSIEAFDHRGLVTKRNFLIVVK